MVTTEETKQLSQKSTPTGFSGYIKLIIGLFMTLSVIIWFGDWYIPKHEADKYREGCLILQTALNSPIEGINDCIYVAEFIQCENRWFKVYRNNICDSDQLRVKRDNFNLRHK